MITDFLLKIVVGHDTYQDLKKYQKGSYSFNCLLLGIFLMFFTVGCGIHGYTLLGLTFFCLFSTIFFIIGIEKTWHLKIKHLGEQCQKKIMAFSNNKNTGLVFSTEEDILKKLQDNLKTQDTLKEVEKNS